MLDTSDEVPDLSLSGRAEDWAALLLDALSSQGPGDARCPRGCATCDAFAVGHETRQRPTDRRTFSAGFRPQSARLHSVHRLL